MFEDKELLNIILYEKRFATYIFCLVIFVAGILLGMVKVPDKEVTEAYKNSGNTVYVYKDDLKGIDNFEITEENNEFYVSLKEVPAEKIAGVYINDLYIKINFEKEKKAKITVPAESGITGYVTAKQEIK